jgi:hypothetical protein
MQLQKMTGSRRSARIRFIVNTILSCGAVYTYDGGDTILFPKMGNFDEEKTKRVLRDLRGTRFSEKALLMPWLRGT